MEKTASCIGVRNGGIIRRNARMSVARPVNMGIDFCVVAAEVAKFLSAEERSKVRPAIKTEDAMPVDLGIDIDDMDMLAAEVAEAWQPCKSEDDGAIKRGARISVARPRHLDIDPAVIEAGIAELVASAERRQAGQRAKRGRRPARDGHAAGKEAVRGRGRRHRVEVVVASDASTTRRLRGCVDER
jgi:hypothetical protein